MSTRERMTSLIEYAQSQGWTYSRLAATTGIGANRWSDVKNGKVEPRLSEGAAILALFPQFTTWLMTGETDPANGQVSPEVEQGRKSSPGAANVS
ncbi:helix-turn-helix domain-containing protein [Arhodomonas sp. AD133]|uniref:helix-turn-helix domain-containing protein n=1 Tax=Arhodomonas sp. AD133 TaxID=3415009 RepID=UPI003EBB93DD